MTKNKGGRPLKYSPDELETEAQKYFDFCDNKENRLDKGIGGKVPKPKTLSGLCKRLGVYKDYISEKIKDPKFSETIKRIRVVVENDVEEGILQGIYNASAGIFNLKNNFDRSDKKQIEHSGEMKQITSVTYEEDGT